MNFGYLQVLIESNTLPFILGNFEYQQESIIKDFSAVASIPEGCILNKHRDFIDKAKDLIVEDFSYGRQMIDLAKSNHAERLATAAVEILLN